MVWGSSVEWFKTGNTGCVSRTVLCSYNHLTFFSFLKISLKSKVRPVILSSDVSNSRLSATAVRWSLRTRVGLSQWLSSKESACNAGATEDMGSVPGSGRSPGGHGNPLQYSCLENLTDRGAWWAIVHGVTESWTQPKRLSMHALTRV